MGTDLQVQLSFSSTPADAPETSLLSKLPFMYMGTLIRKQKKKKDLAASEAPVTSSTTPENDEKPVVIEVRQLRLSFYI